MSLSEHAPASTDDAPALAPATDTTTTAEPTATTTTTTTNSDAVTVTVPAAVNDSNMNEKKSPEDAVAKTNEANPKGVASGWRALVSVGEDAHPAMMLFVMSMYTFFTSILSQGVLPSILTTIQAQYGLSSLQSGWIVSIADTVVCLILIPIGLWAPNHHMPRILSVFTIVDAAGAFLFGLPYFFAASNPTLAYGLFLAGNALIGFGNAPQYVLCNVYFSLMVSKRRLPHYNAIYIAMSTLGPAIGFLVGGVCSTPDLWWIPFFACGGFLVLFAILGWWLPKSRDVSLIKLDDDASAGLPCFPKLKKLPGGDVSADDLTTGGNTVDTQIVEYFGDIKQTHSPKKLIQAFWRVISDRTVIFTTIVSCAGGFIIGAIVTFAPQFSQFSFSLDPDISAIAFGASAIPGAVLGTLLGGWICKRINASNEGVLWVTFLSLALTVPQTPIFFIPIAAVFFPLLIVIEITSFMSTGLISTIISRVVETKDRGVGLALQTLMSRVLGTVPGPIIMGKLIDNTCLQFSDVGNNCIVYDVAALRLLFFIVLVCCAVIGAVGAGLALFSWRHRTAAVKQMVTSTSSTAQMLSDKNESTVSAQMLSGNGNESTDSVQMLSGKDESSVSAQVLSDKDESSVSAQVLSDTSESTKATQPRLSAIPLQPNEILSI